VATHAVIAALLDDDLDRAIESGLLAAFRCDACTADCQATLFDAHARRSAALAARERFRARAARLQRRAGERARKHETRHDTTPATAPRDTKPPLPAAAAAALARAKAIAAERGRR
jgi:hypothetical protein